MSQIHTIRKKVGSFVAGQNFNFNEEFEISLKNLPHHVQQGVAHATEIELVLSGNFSTTAGSARIKSSDLHGWLDWKGYAIEDFLWFNRKGWHDPIRGAFKFGHVEGKRSGDVAANGTGGRVVTAISLSKHFCLLEENMGPLSMHGRLMPSIALAKKNGRILISANGEDTEVRPASAAATGKWDSLTVDAYVHLLDLPAGGCIIPILVEEAAVSGKTELNPTPGNGMYLRCALVNSPFMTTTEDDLSDYEKVNSFGTSGNESVKNEDVDPILRDFHAELTDALEPHRPTDAALTNQKREFRMLDEHENDDGNRRLIPLVRPRPGQEFSDMRRWYGTEPILVANDDSRDGLPASVDFLIDRVAPRESKHVTAILDALGPKARSKRPGLLRGWQNRPGVELQRVPLIVDGRE